MSKKSPPQRADKPNSVPFYSPPCGASLRVTIIPLAPSLLKGSSSLPGDFGRAVLMASPYLALLRAGFCLPPMLPPARCALTAPFHHCLPAGSPRRAALRASAVCFLCHCPSGCPDRALPGALPCGVRTFLPPSPAKRAKADDRLAPCGGLQLSVIRLPIDN